MVKSQTEEQDQAQLSNFIHRERGRDALKHRAFQLRHAQNEPLWDATDMIFIVTTKRPQKILALITNDL